MYAYFPLLLVAIAAAMLGTWVIQDAGFRRAPWLAWPGRCLLALLPLVLIGLAGNSFFAPVGRAASPWLIGVLTAAGALLLAAVATTLIARTRQRRAPGPAIPGLLGPTLLIPAIGIISACFLLSVLLALTNGTLAFGG